LWTFLFCSLVVASLPLALVIRRCSRHEIAL
jgi:hypothetical protein